MTPEEFLQIFEQSQPDPNALSYRLYYDEHGEPLFYTMDRLPGTYIEITSEQFARANSHVRVKNGKLVEKSQRQQVKKLKPAATGVPCHPQDVCVVVDNNQPNIQWSIAVYEQD